MSEPILAPERRDLVRFAGADSIRFLQDLLSQEVAGMPPGTVARSFLLGPQGKLDHLLWVLRGESELILATDEGRGVELAATLGRYRIRVDVTIDHGLGSGWLLLGGEGAGSGGGAVDGGVGALIPWSGPPMKLVSGGPPVESVLEQSDWDVLRILAGEPRYGVDVDETTIPQETGLVAEAVDFTKGCFLGQELVSRIDSRGHVNRHLRGIEFESPAPSAGSEVVGADRSLGVMTTSAGRLGMGLLRREVGPGDMVEVAGRSGRVFAVPDPNSTGR